MNFHILGIGVATPEHSIAQEAAAAMAVETWGGNVARVALIPAIYRRAGVRRRHSVLLEASTNDAAAKQSLYQPLQRQGDRGPTTAERMERYERESLRLATQAAVSAMHDAHISAAEIDHLVTVSCTGFSAPGVDLGLIDSLGLRTDVSRTHVGFMGCHGALNGLRAAAALQRSKYDSHVLVCCVELCSLHQQYSDRPDQIVANALFSDGAAALVGGPSNAGRLLELVAQRSLVLPDTRDLMTWKIRDHGFEMTLSPKVPTAIRESVAPWLTDWLAEHHLNTANVAWAIHPGGPRVLTACGAALGLREAQLAASREILANYGNMSSGTILFLLQTLVRQDRAAPIVALAFGPGLTMEAALFRGNA